MERDCKHVSRERGCLTCVGVSKSDGRQKADSSLQAITKSSQDVQQFVGADDGRKQKRQGNPSPRFHIEGFAETPPLIKSCTK